VGAGVYTPFVYIYEKAVRELQVPGERASLIVSVLGVANTVGRLAVGLVGDRASVDAVLVHNVAAVAAGLLTCLVAVLFRFDLLCLYAALFGLAIGQQPATVPPAVGEGGGALSDTAIRPYAR